MGNSIPKWKGSGPTSGVLGVNSNSIGALKNYYPKNGGVEYIFDTKTNTFVVGKPNGVGFSGSPHQQLVQTIGADESNIVGGTFSRGANGEIFTTENSGHFGQNWTPEIRQQFQNAMENYRLPVVIQNGGVKMFVNNLIAIIEPFINQGINVRITNDEQSNLKIMWIQVLLVWEPNFYMGVSENGHWVVEDKCGLRVLDNIASFARVKILLERDMSDIIETISCNLHLDKTTDVFNVFPFVELVNSVLTEGMDYWVSLALKWCEEFPIQKLNLIRNNLISTLNNSNLSQKNRHKLMKLYSRLECK